MNTGRQPEATETDAALVCRSVPGEALWNWRETLFNCTATVAASIGWESVDWLRQVEAAEIVPPIDALRAMTCYLKAARGGGGSE